MVLQEAGTHSSMIILSLATVTATPTSTVARTLISLTAAPMPSKGNYSGSANSKDRELQDV